MNDRGLRVSAPLVLAAGLLLGWGLGRLAGGGRVADLLAFMDVLAREPGWLWRWL